MVSFSMPGPIFLLVCLASDAVSRSLASDSIGNKLEVRKADPKVQATCSYYEDTSNSDVKKHNTQWAIVAPNAAGDLDTDMVGLNLKSAIASTDCKPLGKTWVVHVDDAKTGFIVTWSSQTECGKSAVELAASYDSIVDSPGQLLVCHEVKKAD